MNLQNIPGRMAAVGGAVVMFGFALAACSSSTHSSTGSSATTAAGGSSATTAAGAVGGGPAPSGTPVKVGFIGMSNSAQQSALTVAIPALKAWASWTNANGGINGHPVQIDVQLEPGNPGVALSDVKKLVGDGVIGIVDADGGNDAAWTTYIEQQKIPVYASGFESPQMTVSSDDFSPATSEFYFVYELLEAAKKVGKTKMAFMYCAEQPVCAQELAPLKQVAKQLGVQIVYTTSILASAPNYTAQCLATKSAGANILYIADAPAPVLSVAASCTQQGYNPTEISEDGAFSQSFAGKPGFDDMIAAEDNVPFFVTSTPATKAMHDAFQKYQPSVLKSPNYDEDGVLMWTSGQLIAEGAKAGGVGSTAPVSGAALQAGMYKLGSTNVDGMTPTLTFTPGQPHESQCWFWVRLTKGNFSTPFGLTPACAPAPKNLNPTG